MNKNESVKIDNMEANLVVIGSGVAGLSAAVAAGPITPSNRR